jgi:hypothetical protein
MQKSLAKAIFSVGLLIGSTQAATISGTVTDSTAQTPVSNVIVQVRSGSQVLAADTTDAQGAYSITAGDSGRVTVRASLSGTYNSKSIDTTLTATPYTLDFSLAKIITSTISGVITDSATGTALAGVIVRLGTGGGGSSTARDTTGEDGAFSFTNVRTGEQTLQASLTGYISKSITATVSSADLVTANIAIVKIIYAKVSGVIKDSTTGAFLAGVAVRLGSGGTSRRDTTGEDGAYSFDSVASGTQSIQVSKSQYTTKTVQVTISSSEPVTADVLMNGVTYVIVSGIVSDSAAGTALAGAVVSLGGVRDTTGTDGAFSFDSVRSGSQTLSISLSRYKSKTVQLTISGTEPVSAPVALVGIVYASVGGIITDTATGLPLSGAVVRIGSGFGGGVTDTTGTDGAFLFTEVQEGTQTITVSCAKYTGKTGQVTVSGTTAVTASFAIVAIVYGSVSGVVTDSATGTALAGAVVRLGGSIGVGGSVDTTGTDGAYSFAEAATGNQTITVTYPKYTTKTAQVTIVGGTPDTTNFTLVVIIYASVSGIVTDSVTGTPLTGVEVRIGPTGTYLYDTTGADGAYQFTEVPAGSAPMKITATGYAFHRDTLTIANATPVTHNIAMGEKTAIISRNISKLSSGPQLQFSGENLIVSNFTGKGTISIFSLNGICIYNAVLNNTGRSMILPDKLRTHGSSVIVQFATKEKTFTQRILLVR